MARNSFATLGSCVVWAALSAPVAANDLLEGVYIGGHLGFGSGSANIINLGPSTTWAAADQETEFDPEGGLFGLHAGRNFTDGDFVYGIELSVDLADIATRIDSPYLPANHDYEVSIDNRISLSGRYGQEFEGWLFYGRAGYTAGEVTFRGIDTAFPANEYTQTNWHHGWHFGVGAEREVAENISLGIDLTHTDLGSVSDTGFWTASGGAILGDPQSFTVDAQATVISLRLSYSY